MTLARPANSTLLPGKLGGLAALLLLAAHPASQAQTTVRGNPCDGQYAYVVRDAKTGQVVSRGRTTTRGGLPADLVLGANRAFTVSVANGENGFIGAGTFTTGPDGSTTELPRIQVGDSIAPDSDGDSIPDDIEEIYGTDPRKASTLGGISDKALISAPAQPGAGGLSIPNNPAFGSPGIISSVQLPGNAVDICTFNDMAAVACLDRGVAIFNIFGGLTPRQIALVDTPGEARAVGCPGFDVPVADGPAGLAIIDIRDPASARIRAQVPLGNYAESVASVGGTAYVGLRSGQLCVIDLASATEFQRLNLGGEVFDITIAGDNVWAVAGNTLRSFSFNDGLLNPVGNVPLSSLGPDPLSGRKRIFVGGGWAQVSCLSGFDNIDVRNPASMVLVGRAPASGPGSFKQIIADGSGLGIAPVGVNPRNDGTHDLNLYNLTAPANVTDLLTTLRTPGVAYAGSIYNGFLYVADGDKGLEVFRYKETDFKGVPPVVTLDTSALGGVAEEGKLFRLAANATDDGQVRNVEFFVDGQLAGGDGNFPFEFFFNTPLRTAAKNSFTARARAFDMGGNFSWSPPVTIFLGPDTTPPRVAKTRPAPNTILGNINSIIAFFSEPLRPDSVTPDAFRLVNAGPDGILGTPDDLAAPPGTLTYQDSLRAVVWNSPALLAPGLWHAELLPSIADRGGRTLELPYRWNFILFNQPDKDQDGVPDSLESLLGLDPNNPDSKGDGVRDGDRDFDGDGLSNAAEVLLGLDPRKKDTNGDGIPDGSQDTDGDGLPDGKEVLYGSNPLVADSDGDGWNDESEVTGGSDPIDPLSRPRPFLVANPPVHAVLPTFSAGGDAGRLLIVARPAVSIGLPNVQGADIRFGTVMAQPPVHLGVMNLGTPAAPLGTIIAHPPVEIGINKQ